VKPVDEVQLANWHRYLDFTEKEGNLTRVSVNEGGGRGGWREGAPVLVWMFHHVSPFNPWLHHEGRGPEQERNLKPSYGLNLLSNCAPWVQTINVFERCVVPCANYPEYWVRYVERMDAESQPEKAAAVLGRATGTFGRGERHTGTLSTPCPAPPTPCPAPPPQHRGPWESQPEKAAAVLGRATGTFIKVRGTG